jgi:hypothetical protein
MQGQEKKQACAFYFCIFLKRKQPHQYVKNKPFYFKRAKTAQTNTANEKILAGGWGASLREALTRAACRGSCADQLPAHCEQGTERHTAPVQCNYESATGRSDLGRGDIFTRSPMWIGSQGRPPGGGGLFALQYEGYSRWRSVLWRRSLLCAWEPTHKATATFANTVY